MNVFNLRDQLVGNYSSYVKSFININDEAIQAHVGQRLYEGMLWPDHEPRTEAKVAVFLGATLGADCDKAHEFGNEEVSDKYGLSWKVGGTLSKCNATTARTVPTRCLTCFPTHRQALGVTNASYALMTKVSKQAYAKPSFQLRKLNTASTTYTHRTTCFLLSKNRRPGRAATNVALALSIAGLQQGGLPPVRSAKDDFKYLLSDSSGKRVDDDRA